MYRNVQIGTEIYRNVYKYTEMYRNVQFFLAPGKSKVYKNKFFSVSFQFMCADIKKTGY